MSFAGRRRRRGGRRSSSLAGDPLDLFLDAITNALGVIMFILLMVVLFGRAQDTPRPDSPLRTVEDVRKLEQQARDLEAILDALPPAGDPELYARWKAAMARFPDLEREIDRLRSEIRRSEADARAAEGKFAEEQARMERISAAIAEAQRQSKAPSGFVRISRFQSDGRKAIILAVAGGKVARIRATKETTSISAPTGGTPITNQASADVAVRELLDGFLPSTHRVELIVWEGSFLQAKLIENSLESLRFDSNPIPVRAGTALEPGAGGVQ